MYFMIWTFCQLLIALQLLSSARASAPLVTCGSVIKLAHARTSYLLHSHEIAYGSGSGQQSVTGYDSSDDANSLWILRGLQGHHCSQGSSIKSGFQLRLQHAATRKFLHSHHFESPLSGQQEVSAFGSDNDSDDMDIWQVDWDKGAGEWTQDQQVRIRHVHTGVYLASGPQRYSRPISGQQEVLGRGKPDWWVATEGIFFPQRTEL